MTDAAGPAAHAGAAGRTVLVTGGNRGIGLATARRLADDGCRVAVTASSPDSARPDDDRLLFVVCDQRDGDAVEAAFATVEAELGAVEVLVANAGITDDKLLLRMSDADFTAVVETNLTGAFRMARRAVRQMLRARWGRLVFVSSVSAAMGAPGQANYAASKAGLVGLARSLARELGSRAITANVVAPGPVATDILVSLTPSRLESIVAAVPLGRIAEPDEIAAAIAYLASDDAAFVTGAVLAVDGGMSMGQ
ncbi:MAG TPA: beta-ketoacyl-ACP reductase [Acidimicrobiaceae bacterium]|nr:beta-ketoacyl-ACP reductase [Acidimicrobiaceae bacterium]HCB37840.1 beta-ketoacyl-ACP reductase [Acidimicrobiaceae bacterium]